MIVVPALTSEQWMIVHAMISIIENHRTESTLSWVLLWWRDKYPDSVYKGYQVNLQNVLTSHLPNLCYKTTSGLKLDVDAFDKEEDDLLRDALNKSFPNQEGLVSRIKERAIQGWDDICYTLDLNAHLSKPAKKVKETKEGTGPAKKQALPDETENGKGNEREKELEKKPEEKKEKDNEKHQ